MVGLASTANIMQDRKSKKDVREKAVQQVHRHNLDTMLLLAAYPPFQVDVAQLRADFSIPEQGLVTLIQPTKDKVVYDSTWRRQLQEKTDREARSPEFRQKMRDLQTQFEKQQIAYSEYQDKLRTLNDSLPLNRWRLTVKGLAKKYRLPSHFKRHIQDYILTNAITAPAQNYAITDKLSFRGANDKRGEHEISIKIHYKPTITEWQAIRQWVTSHTHTPRPRKKTRLRPHTQIEQDLKILHESSEKGVDEKVLSDRDIAEKIWPQHPAPRGSQRLREIIKQARLRIRRAQKQLFDDG